MINTSTASDTNLMLARKWIHNCISNHSKCGHPAKDKPWFPSRLIELGQVDTEAKARLHISSKGAPKGPYMTLSHCWGNAQFLKLLVHNVEAMEKNIPFSNLPKSFKDAIDITRALGVRYLWIDALCIIQDSTEDWRKEAAEMGNVYKNGFCNIAATGALNSSIGCFWDRNPLLIQACKIYFKWRESPRGSFYCCDKTIWPKNVGDTPLNNRAWVAQERLLSPRIVHFGSQQLCWECHELEACETFPAGIPRSRDPTTFIVRTGLKRLTPLADDQALFAVGATASDSLSDPYEFWDGVVDAYTRSAMTREEDKLIALSGFAKGMELVLKDRYLAGLWERYLGHQLLWWVSRPMSANNGNPCSRPNKYRAPSWSWASINGNVIPGGGGRDSEWKFMPSLLEAYITAVGNDTTGQVANGWLRIRGILKPAKSECLWRGRLYQLLLDDEYTDSNNFSPDVESDLEGQDVVHCLPLFEKSWEGERYIRGLVLSNTRHSQFEFVRLGIFKAQGNQSCNAFLSEKYTGSAQSNTDIPEREIIIL